jgi:predicted AlkP superfamily phosphohydrolase/phosphomutase
MQMEKNKKQIIAIGLEAAEIDLILKWIKEGHLPTLATSMETGSWRKLMSTTEISSGATWASINTGVSPAKHGMGFYHRQLKNGSYQIVKKYADEIGYPLFWEKLSNAGKRAAILDIPVTYPVKDFNGVQLIGWGAEGLNFKQSSQPRELLKEIFSRFGHHPLEGWYQKVIEDVNEWNELKQKLITGVQLRTSIVKWILEKEAWDFFLVGFAEMHWVGHYFWHLIDDSNPEYNSEVAQVCGDAIFKVYKEVDNSINEIMQAYPDVAFLIFSNTGMGPNYSGQHLIPEILKRTGLGANGKNQGSKNIFDMISPAKKWGPYAIKKVESIVSAETMEKAKKIVPEKLWDSWTRKFLAMGNNWKHSKAFTVPTDFTGAIRINLIGREPEGLVNPGKEYDDVCSEIKNTFLELVNPDTGKKAIKEVIKVRERYNGKYIDDLPDIIVKWEGKYPINSLYSSRIGTVTGKLPDKRSGAHQTYGFIIANGKNIKSLKELEEKNIMDIAPTVFNFFNIAIPEDMDGEVLNDMIEKE